MLRTPTPELIESGAATDYCSVLALRSLKNLSLDRRTITVEAHVRRFPESIERGIFFGLEDLLATLGGRNIEVWSMEPGEFFFEGEPVVVLRGAAADLALLRPALTGILTFGSSIVTRAAEFVAVAGGRPVFFFGSRKLHPAHLLQYLECAYVSGMEISASTLSEHIVPDAALEDCQEHFVNIVADDLGGSWQDFISLPDDAGAQFIVLDNFNDPVTETSQAVELLGSRLKGVLLDTDATRRGDLGAILRELAWKLSILGREDVKIALTGGVTPEIIRETSEYVASYGVGLSVLEGKSFDFALQIVEVEDRPRSKVGVMPGRKSPFRCSECSGRAVRLMEEDAQCCGSAMEPLLQDATLVGAKTIGEVRGSLLERLGVRPSS